MSSCTQNLVTDIFVSAYPIFRLCKTQPTTKTFVFPFLYSVAIMEKILVAFIFLCQFARHKVPLKIADVRASKWVIRWPFAKHRIDRWKYQKRCICWSLHFLACFGSPEVLFFNKYHITALLGNINSIRTLIFNLEMIQ